MPLPGFRQIDHTSYESGDSDTTYLHNSNVLLLIRTEFADVNGDTAAIGWMLVGPPVYNRLGHGVRGKALYLVWDQYSDAKLATESFDISHTNLQVPGMTQKERLEDLGRVVDTATKLLAPQIQSGSKGVSRIRTALEAGLSDEDALLYVNGQEGKISRAGKQKLKKHAENSKGGVMLDPMLPGESLEEWAERTGRDLGDGAPTL